MCACMIFAHAPFITNLYNVQQKCGTVMNRFPHSQAKRETGIMLICKAKYLLYKYINNQRTIGPENAHLKPDPGVHVLSHHEMTLTLNTHTPLLNS